jgi:SEC-C motif-containing protein
MSVCPCGSTIAYLKCCGLFIRGDAQAESPEILMRSRYSAYATGKIAYIERTMRGKPLIGFDVINVKRWAKRAHWLGLEVLKAHMESEEKGFVEFIARFREAGALKMIHERSEFHRINGVWYYVDGELKP